MRPKRSRFTLLGVLTLALCVTVGMSAGVAEAQKKKKKKAGGTAQITQAVNAPIPDATPSLNGQLISTIDVAGKKFKKTRIRDVDVTLQTIGNAAGASGDLYALLSSPNGTTVPLFFFLGGSVNIGPLTFSDQTNVTAGFCPGTAPLDPNTLCQPYVGTSMPAGVLAAMNDGAATGTYTLRVVDTGPPGPPGPTLTSILSSWTLNVVAGKKYLTQ